MGQEDKAPRPLAEATAGAEQSTGFLPLWVHAEQPRAQLLVPHNLGECLYFVGLAEGLGSNPLGLDRGSFWRNAVVEFRRHGNDLLLVQKNLRFRSTADSPALRTSVEESFADAILYRFAVEAEDSQGALIDVTPFLLQDSVGVAATLEDSGQGRYSLDSDCSVLATEQLATFPRNTELSAWLTLRSDRAGPILRRNAADGTRVTVRVHHSFVALPEPGYQPRPADPRVGCISHSFADYSQPLDQPLLRHFVQRWRLQKKHPKQALSDPIQPILYYLDPAIQEPLRSAIAEGALWWNRVFESAGFKNAFQLHDLPEGADPMDARYSTIQVVHRSERGWSYGATQVDPRTGEILKAGVRMDSHRARADANLFRGMGLELGCGGAVAGLDPWVSRLQPDLHSQDLILARIRQLAAHEVGHTLGFSHNFMASTYGRASVMDYPAPWVRVVDDELDFSAAYATDAGAYDHFAVRYAYAQPQPGQSETELLKEIVQGGLDQGLTYLTDLDARAPGSAHPDVALWDNGKASVAALEEALAVRRRLLDGLAEHGLSPGEEVFWLQRRLAPVYYYHIFALERAIRAIGGVRYTYAVQGDGQIPVQAVPREEQQAALHAVMQCLQPDVLALPEGTAQLLAPPPPLWNLGNDGFRGSTGRPFDRLGTARGLAQQTLSFLLHPQRCARLKEQEAAGVFLGLRETLDQLRSAVFPPEGGEVEEVLLQRLVQHTLVNAMTELAGGAAATDEVRAEAQWQLRSIGEDLAAQVHADAHSMATRIRRFLERPAPQSAPPLSHPSPQTSPIGSSP
jgi:hypothetical protein